MVNRMMRRLALLPLGLVGCMLQAGCAPYDDDGRYGGNTGAPRRLAYQPGYADRDRRDYDRRDNDRRGDDRRGDDRRGDDRRGDDRRDSSRQQDVAQRQQRYNQAVASLQAQHNERVRALQTQFNQGRINRGQLDDGYRQSEQQLNRAIANEQRNLPR